MDMPSEHSARAAQTDDPEPQSGLARTRNRLPGTVVALGITSFFTDVGTEMIFPLLPVFVASLGATPAFLGLVEGVAEATASLLKLGSGYVADRVPRKKPLVLFGYGLSALARPLMSLAGAPWHVLAVRAADRVGKGVRTAPRDALLASSVSSAQAGRAFGLHRAMDHGGAVVGPLIATALLALGFSMREVFLAALVPGVLAIVAILPIRELPREAAPARTVAHADAPAASTELPRSFYTYLAIILLFSLGASTDAFLLLRAGELGVPTALLPTLWVVLHVSKLLSSYYGGMLADRLPRARLIVAGWVVYALAYLGLGMATEAWQVWALFVFYGLYYGLTEPTERALIRDLAPREVQGRAFGMYHFAVGLSAIPASLLTGWVWQSVSSQAALQLGAAIAACASVALWWWSVARAGEERASA
jgi:MFS family permease